ncbi:transposase [Methylobacterium sp. WL30]|nr:transposase [Methylobacterium sp. WL116]TXN36586.1 transposase [Methylobacterium sp. WL93]TXN49336.1 transposase [Methylobacterium sp. WL119]TXN67654.1 transposase [Methylobacterium sp. WL30]
MRSYDFVEHRTHRGRKQRTLNVVAAPRIVQRADPQALAQPDHSQAPGGRRDRRALGLVRFRLGTPSNPPGQRAGIDRQTVQNWIAAVGSRAACIKSGGPWENGYCESFNAKLRDERLNGEVIFATASRPTCASSEIRIGRSPISWANARPTRRRRTTDMKRSNARVIGDLHGEDRSEEKSNLPP